MSPIARIVGYAAVLVVALVIGLGLGTAVGPIDVGDDRHGDGPAPLHDDRDHGWGS